MIATPQSQQVQVILEGSNLRLYSLPTQETIHRPDVVTGTMYPYDSVPIKCYPFLLSFIL